MSKKGRSSVVLLGSLVVCLLLIPLVYLAFGAKLDRIALNKRIALLESTSVTSPAALQARYRTAREHILAILPPDPEYRINPSGGLVVFDPASFSWAAGLEAAELNGVTVYPVTVAEDPETRYTAFYNGSAELIGYLAPEQDYFPFAWLADRYPEYYDENADPDVLTWAEALYDPARVSVTYYLLPADDVEAMAEAQLADDQPDFEMNMMMGEGMTEPVTNLVIFAIEQATNGMALGVGWPDDFTNKLEVFARSTIATSGWFVASSNLSTVGTNSLWWTDTSLTTSDVTRFYSVGNADLDSDGDGVVDARERKVTGTDENGVDTDGDGLVDGYSGKVTTNSYPAGTRTNGGVYVEGEMTWGTALLLIDTDGDGMGDGWEVANGHDPLDPNDPPSVSGTVSYNGGQTGVIRVVAVTSSGSWATNDGVIMAAPGPYLIPNLTATSYWIKAWRDSDGDGAVDTPEAWGVVAEEAVLVTNRLTGQDITLADPDNDSDGLPDWWEIARFGSTTNCTGSGDPDADQYTNLEEYEAGTDPLNALSHPWNISGTISYAGPQAGTIYIVACTAATEWVAAQYASLSTTGSYTITHLPPDQDYWIRAWRDSEVDGIPAFWEAWGDNPENPVTLNTNVTAMDVTLLDTDSDGDGLPDWWEVLYGFDPHNGGGATASAWWKLNATTGTNVQDSTSHANNGILLNAGTNCWGTGVISNALFFDGVDDYVQIPDSEILKPTVVSVSLWIKPSHDYTNGTAVFFSKKQPGGSTGYQLSYEQGKLTFSVCVSGERVVSRPYSLTSGVWHHVVGTYAGTHQRLYVDGALVAQADYSWGTGFGFIDQGATVARIGASAGSSAASFFAGAIDDVRLYAGELTTNQVRGLYGQGSDEDDDGLSAWQEYHLGTDPVMSDTDGDDLPDGEELLNYGTDPLSIDSDGDEMPDGWEVLFGLNPTNWADAWIDTDGDGYCNLEEFWLGTDPNSKDTDQDGFEDAADNNPASRLVIQWGNPQFTFGDAYRCTGPVWWKAAYKINGAYDGVPPYGWSAEGGGVTSRQNMVVIPAGTNAGVEPDDGPYSLTARAFLMDQTEVTKELWDTVHDWGLTNGYFDLPAGSGKMANHPVQTVNWYDCVKWCNARSEMEGLTPTYYTGSTHKRVYRSGMLDLQLDQVQEGSGGYRLPTRSEWAYGGRGGVTGTRFPWGDTISHAQANYYSYSNGLFCLFDISETHGCHPNYCTNGQPYTSPVASFAAYGYGNGLYDMVGNVEEWTWDRSPRGGRWNSYGKYSKLNHDTGGYSLYQGNDTGFRTVIDQFECLVIAVDRQLLTNNAVLEMTYLDAPGAELHIELADGQSPVVLDLCGNLVAGSGQITNRLIEIPFADYPCASQIRIMSPVAGATVYTNRLYVDQDRDGFDADQEAQLGTSDIESDSDGDDISDWLEAMVLHTSPTNWDSDANTISDYDEDFDEDGLPNGVEVNGLAGIKNPFLKDTDGDTIEDYDEDFDEDGLSDGDEVMVYGTSYDKRDTDSDYLNDGEEVTLGTDPLDPDMDEDGLRDGSEIYGLEAWSVSTSDIMSWVGPSTNAHWIADWTTGIISNGFVMGGLSSPLNVPFWFGPALHETARISTDGVVLFGSNSSSEALSYGVNLPLAWPGLENILAVCWDEYSISATTGVWYEVSGSGDTTRVVVTWTGAKVKGFGASEEGLDFQLDYAATNRAFAFRYRTAFGLEFPTQALFTVGARGDSTNRMCRIIFNRLGFLDPGSTITLTPAVTSPTNTDSDADGMLDGEETNKGLDPSLPENQDSDVDGDGLMFSEEMAEGTDPFDVDTDRDGLDDGYEVEMSLDPVWPDDAGIDWDYDGLTPAMEYCIGTYPKNAHTDNDSVNDGMEFDQGSDPLDPADSGMAPEATFEFKPRLYTDSPIGLGGTVFIVGKYWLTPVMFGEDHYARINLSHGREHGFGIATRQGFVQCPSPQVEMAVDGQPPHEQVPGKEMWVCGNTVLYNPNTVFTVQTVRPAVNEHETFRAVLTGPSAIRERSVVIESPGGVAVQTSWCRGSTVRLVARAIPNESGEWSWTIPTNIPSIVSGSNVTLTLTENINVMASYSYGGTTPISTNVGLTIHDINTIQFDLPPVIAVNDNDSDGNGTNDCLQPFPTNSDPQIVTATVAYNKACSCTQLGQAKLTVTCEEGADKVRSWSMDLTTNQLPTAEPISSGNTVSFKVEGVAVSSTTNDVKYKARVEYPDQLGVSLESVKGLAVLKVEIVFTNDYTGLSAYGPVHGTLDGTKWVVATFPDPNQTNIYWNAHLLGLASVDAKIKYQRGTSAEVDVGWEGTACDVYFTNGWLNASVRLNDGSNSVPRMSLVSNVLTIASVQQGDRIIVEEPVSGCRDEVAVVKNFSWNDLQRLGAGNLSLHSDFDGLTNAIGEAIVKTIVFCLDPTDSRDQKAQLTNDFFPDSGISFINWYNFSATYTNLLQLDIPSARSVGIFPDDYEHWHMGLEVDEASIPSAITNKQAALAAAVAMGGSFTEVQSNTVSILIELLNMTCADASVSFALSHTYEGGEGHSANYVDPNRTQTLKWGDPIRSIRWEFGFGAEPLLSFPGDEDSAAVWNAKPGWSDAPEDIRQVPFFVNHEGKIIFSGAMNIYELHDGMVHDAVYRE